MAATVQTTDGSTDYDYYLLNTETDLSTEALTDLPSSVTHWYPDDDEEADWTPSLAVDSGEAYVLRVDTAQMQLTGAKVSHVVHPEPAGERTFSSATQTTFTTHGFHGSHSIEADTVFALDTTCLELTNTVGSQFQIDRRGD